MSPAPNGPHQDISYQLKSALLNATRNAGLRTRLAITVRMAADRILIPDLVVAKGARVTTMTDAAEVVLVAEVTSPHNAAVDRVQKMHFYAAARIEWYLLVEPDMREYESVRLRLFRLTGEHFIEHAAAEHGETLISDSPFPIEISTVDLLDF